MKKKVVRAPLILDRQNHWTTN